MNRFAKAFSSREAKRWKSDSVITGRGSARSTASCTAQRPSPESSTKPRSDSSLASAPRARSASSSSQERTTLPWF